MSRPSSFRSRLISEADPYSSLSSVFFGIFLCIVLVIPIGIITSITGVQITLNVFAEFIGGVIYPENALAMNYFKSYGVMYVDRLFCCLLP